jgi:hypothetical protein
MPIQDPIEVVPLSSGSPDFLLYGGLHAKFGMRKRQDTVFIHNRGLWGLVIHETKRNGKKKKTEFNRSETRENNKLFNILGETTSVIL